jgi:hypothetical protein
LAEEETRLVAKSPGGARAEEEGIAGDFSWCIFCVFVVVVVVWWWFENPRTGYRPQTACGRYCPWEPTALDVILSDPFRDHPQPYVGYAGV